MVHQSSPSLPTEKVAIVTGAASGIGRAIAGRFLLAGVRVVGIDRDETGLRSVEGIIPYPCDLIDHNGLEGAVRLADDWFGRIDILINNAGTCFYEHITESSLENWRTTFAVNIEGMYALTRSVAPHMVARQYGRIVNISSTQSISVEPNVGAYAATKGAINAWTRSLAVELAPHHILVNGVAPGCIHTKMSVVNGVDETTTPDFQEWYVRRRKIPLARPGRPDEIASVVAFLSGEECSYLTGQVLIVDGGLTSTF